MGIVGSAKAPAEVEQLPAVVACSNHHALNCLIIPVIARIFCTFSVFPVTTNSGFVIVLIPPVSYIVDRPIIRPDIPSDPSEHPPQASCHLTNGLLLG